MCSESGGSENSFTSDIWLEERILKENWLTILSENGSGMFFFLILNLDIFNTC